MKQIYDGPLSYPDNWNGEATCHIQIYQDGTDFSVIATELPENHGTSITNAVERVVTIVCRRFSIDPRNLTWIEHYPERNTGCRDSIFAESYARVSFEILSVPRMGIYDACGTIFVIVARPQWTHLSLDDPLITRLLNPCQSIGLLGEPCILPANHIGDHRAANGCGWDLNTTFATPE